MFVVVDIETTGLSRFYHRITEIAAVRVSDGFVVDSFQSLVNPEVPIPRFITRLTGISDDLVKDSPVVQDVLPSFRSFLGSDVFVGHNAFFDFGFLDLNMQRYLGFGLSNSRLCTRKLANRLFPDLPRKRLCDLCSHLNIVNSRAHRALSDVHATVGVFNHMLDLLREKGIVDVDDLLRFEKSRIKPLVSLDS